MEEGREYIIIETYNDKGEVEEKMIDIYEAAEIMNRLTEMCHELHLDLDDALGELEFWKTMYEGYATKLN